MILQGLGGLSFNPAASDKTNISHLGKFGNNGHKSAGRTVGDVYVSTFTIKPMVFLVVWIGALGF